MRLEPEAKLFFIGLAGLIIALTWWLLWESGMDTTGLGFCTIGILILTITVAVVVMDPGSGPR